MKEVLIDSRIQFSFVYNLRRKTLWNPATTSNAINDNDSWYSAVSKIKKFENCFLATQAE